MKRRSFLISAATTTALVAPAIASANELPSIKWRLASSFPKSLDTIYSAAETVAKKVAAASGGKFQIQVFAAGEIVPGLNVLDAVKDGTVEVGHTASYYFVGKDPTFAFDGALPFGLNSRQQNAWMIEGGGTALMREFYKDYNLYSIPCGNTGAQMGGWFRKEIKTLEDLKGLKMRIGGFAGQVVSKLGVIPQQIPGGDIYPALEKGTIDAAEWIGPVDDEKLGFSKVAKNYYYPGFWEGSLQVSLLVNHKMWESLPPAYQAILEAACAEAHLEMQGKYDVRNPQALKRLVGSGVQLKAFPNEILQAAHKAALELYEENAAKNPKFKKVYENWRKFQQDQLQWFAVAEGRFDSFMQTTRSAAKKAN
ncbi:MAG: TRAP transporter substrate-binding protein [Burkholderiales bacterium]|nr:TRAP transporter substrate-binding protein [Burkholderiales bacterium]